MCDQLYRTATGFSKFTFVAVRQFYTWQVYYDFFYKVWMSWWNFESSFPGILMIPAEEFFLDLRHRYSNADRIFYNRTIDELFRIRHAFGKRFWFRFRCSGTHRRRQGQSRHARRQFSGCREYVRQQPAASNIPRSFFFRYVVFFLFFLQQKIKRWKMENYPGIF